MKKIIIFLFAICITSGITAQKKTFMRIYDLQGKKFAKGFFASTSDSALFISKNDLITELAVSKIGFIKTKRSAGHSILIGGLIGAVPLAVIGVASGTSKRNDGTLEGAISDLFTHTPEDGLISGFIGGAIIGGAMGGLISLLSKRTKFIINGKNENWLQQKALLNKIPVYTAPVEIAAPAN